MVDFSGMAARPFIVLLVLVPLLAVCLWPGTARALCTDPPGPEVNWQRCNFDRLDLAAVDLSGARLRDASFIRADLSGSKLVEADSTRAKFVNAVLKGAVFDKAKLYGADLTKADLNEASLKGADLRLARLFRASLRGADLTGARLGGADLSQADLSGATWTDGERVCAEGSVGRCN
jgi:uncharacterized protein YjbI with pentapeptide repeats